MLRTDAVIKLLTKNKEPMAFDLIWSEVKEDTISTLTKEFEENQVKADLYMSILEDQRFIMIGDNTWGLVSDYSPEEIAEFDKKRITDDIPNSDDLDESEDTKELRLGLDLGEDE